MIHRRQFLNRLALAGAASLLGWRPEVAKAEPPPETPRLRLVHTPSVCLAPQYVAEELLRGEGFTDVQYIKLELPARISDELAAGTVDISLHFAAPLVIQLDRGDPIVLLAGVHVGCFELVATDQVHAIRDLKGRSVAVSGLGGPDHTFVASMLAHVGVDPRRDVTWVTHPATVSMKLLAEGKIDAFLGFPPIPQELRAKKVGRVVVNSATDRPWSQYFCCIATGNREFVRKHPVATKRALRTILKSADICALEPERAARSIIDNGFTPRYDYALQTMKEVPYDKWRVYDPADTLRFYALRLHEAGMVKSGPNKLIAQGTDWRFLNELKKEMKG